MSILQKTVDKITDLDYCIMEKARERVDNLIKPVGSLGKLEDIVVKLTGITGKLHPKADKRSVIVMAADHGVCDEGVAAAPQSVTYIQANFMTKHKTGVCALASSVDADVVVVDIGIKRDVGNPNIINRKIKYGTNNMVNGMAMTREEAIRAIEVGIEISQNEIKKGKNIIATGEMGIGNTTPSSAILSVVTGLSPIDVTGIGANLPEEKVLDKAIVIQNAILRNNVDKKDPIDILSKVGGLDIAGMTGVMLGCAANKVPVIIDGYISTVSAIIAYMIEPKSKKYMFASHSSNERAAKIATEFLGLSTMLDLDMRLGEGSGAVLAMPIIQAAIDMNDKMITFEETDIMKI